MKVFNDFMTLSDQLKRQERDARVSGFVRPAKLEKVEPRKLADTQIRETAASFLLIRAPFARIVQWVLWNEQEDFKQAARALVLTYRLVASASELFEMLCACFDDPASTVHFGATVKKAQVRRRVVTFLEMWTVLEPYDILSDNALLRAFDAFVSKHGIVCDESAGGGKLRVRGLTAPHNIMKGFQESPSSVAVSHATFLLEQGAAEVAKHLTCIDSIVYRGMLASEVLAKHWDKASAPTLVALRSRFNQVTLWTVTTLLCLDKVEEQLRMFAFFIDVAAELTALRSFHSGAAIYFGLVAHQISRLTYLLEGLEKNRISGGKVAFRKFKKVAAIFESARNFRFYRALIADDTLGPFLPFLAVHLRDIVTMKESGTSFTVKEDGKDTNLVNNEKLTLMGNSIAPLCRSKETPIFSPADLHSYSLEKLNIYLVSVRYSTDAELDAMSERYYQLQAQALASAGGIEKLSNLSPVKEAEPVLVFLKWNGINIPVAISATATMDELQKTIKSHCGTSNVTIGFGDPLCRIENEAELQSFLAWSTPRILTVTPEERRGLLKRRESSKGTFGLRRSNSGLNAGMLRKSTHANEIDDASESGSESSSKSSRQHYERSDSRNIINNINNNNNRDSSGQSPPRAPSGSVGAGSPSRAAWDLVSAPVDGANKPKDLMFVTVTYEDANAQLSVSKTSTLAEFQDLLLLLIPLDDSAQRMLYIKQDNVSLQTNDAWKSFLKQNAKTEGFTSILVRDVKVYTEDSSDPDSYSI